MIHLRLPPAAEEHVAVAYSPLSECVMSLKVLLQPKRHPLHRRWAREVRGAGAPLQDAFERYAFAFRDNAPTLFVGSNRGEPSLAEELELLVAMPEAQLRFEFTLGLQHGSLTGGQLADKRAQAKLLADGVRDFPASGETLALLLERPRSFIAEFATFIERYFEQVFAKEWERIEPLLADSVADAGDVGADRAAPRRQRRRRRRAHRRRRLLRCAQPAQPAAPRRRGRPPTRDRKVVRARIRAPPRRRVDARTQRLRLAEPCRPARGGAVAEEHHLPGALPRPAPNSADATRPARSAAARAWRRDTSTNAAADRAATTLDPGARAARRHQRGDPLPTPPRPDRGGRSHAQPGGTLCPLPARGGRRRQARAGLAQLPRTQRERAAVEASSQRGSPSK